MLSKSVVSLSAGQTMETPSEQNPYSAPQATLAASTTQEQRYLADEVEITPEFIAAIQGGKDIAQGIYMQLMCSAIAFAFSFIFVIVSVLATVIGYLVLIFLTVRGLYRLKKMPITNAAIMFSRSLFYLCSSVPIYLLIGLLSTNFIDSEPRRSIVYKTEVYEVLHILISMFVYSIAVYSALFGIKRIGQFLCDNSTEKYGLLASILYSLSIVVEITFTVFPSFKQIIYQRTDSGYSNSALLLILLHYSLVIGFALFTAAAFRRPPRLIDELIRYEEAVAKLPVAEKAIAEQS
jgi:hypothetical protein